MILQEEADKERVKAWEASDEGKAELARRAEERAKEEALKQAKEEEVRRMLGI